MGAARQRARLPWPRLVPIIAANLWVFTSFGIVVPVLPRYVQSDLGGGGADIGLTVLAFAVASVAVRPPVGLLLRTVSARLVMACAGGILAASLALSALADSVPLLALLRVVSGVGMGTFNAAATLLVVQITPAERRGAGISYFSIGLFLGIAVGPPIGEWLYTDVGATAAWLVAGACGVVCALIPFAGWIARPASGSPAGSPAAAAAGRPESVEPAATGRLARLFHPAALWPGGILSLSIAGYAGFQAFVPVYGPTIDMASTAPAFVTYAVVTLAVRVLGGPFVDRFHAATLAGTGCVLNVAGLVTLAVWPAPAAVFVSAVLLAVAVGLLFPALLRLSLDNVSSRDQAPVVATYSGCFDLGQGVGAAALGLVVGGGNYRPAFLVGAVFGLLALSLYAGRYGVRHLRAPDTHPGPDLRREPDPIPSSLTDTSTTDRHQ